MLKLFVLALFVVSSVSFAKPTHNFNGKWYTCNWEEKHNKSGKIVYAKMSKDGEKLFEEWYKYNSKGFLIYEKSTKMLGPERWHKVDSNGKRIYTKTKYSYDNSVIERWIDRDASGRTTHVKDSDGNEDFFEYSANKVHVKSSGNSESFYEMDDNENLTYVKDQYGNEEWYTYDSLGRITSQKNSHGDEVRYIYFEKKIKDGSILYQCNQE